MLRQGVPGLEMIRVRMESDGALVEIGRKETFIVGPDELRENPFAPVPSAQGATGAEEEGPSAHTPVTKKRTRW